MLLLKLCYYFISYYDTSVKISFVKRSFLLSSFLNYSCYQRITARMFITSCYVRTAYYNAISNVKISDVLLIKSFI